MRVVEVTPVGEHVVRGFRCHDSGGVENEWTEATYPPTPEARTLASRRRSLGLTLRGAAAQLEVSAATLSGLEHGRLRFESPADLTVALRKLERGREAGAGGPIATRGAR